MTSKTKKSPRKKEPPTPPSFLSRLKLVPDSRGNLGVRLDGYYIITFHPDGTFRRVRNVSPDTGLTLDTGHRIVEREL